MVQHIFFNTDWGDGLLPENTKPSPQPMLAYGELNMQKHISVKFLSKYEHFLRKY